MDPALKAAALGGAAAFLTGLVSFCIARWRRWKRERRRRPGSTR
jgi:hypothetical protein